MEKSELKPDLYKESGVDIEKGDRLVDWLVADKDSTSSKVGELVGGIGSFAGLFRPNFSHMKDPLLVSGTDGVGTKLLLALDHDKLDGLGLDLVAMCANDIYCIGARAMFFIDYYATGALDENQFKRVLASIKKGLNQCGAFLLGGETAELPGLYAKNHFDLAGFIVGVVDGAKKIESHLVEPGDRLYALASSGFHSNGYSLIRKWIKEKPVDDALISKLLEPTRIYSEIPDLVDQLGYGKIHAVAHITGGGISGNLPRVMPDDTVCTINQSAIPTPKWMKDFVTSNNASFEDVETVFNFGAGMILAIGKNAEADFLAAAKEFRLEPTLIGYVDKGKGPCAVSYRKQ